MSAGTKNKYIRVFIAVLIFLAIKLFLPEINGLTATGVNIIAIFAATIWLWVFASTVWPSLLAFALVIMFVISDPNSLAAVTYGHWSFGFILTAMLLNTALIETGVIDHISTWFISRKICKGRPWVFITMFLLSEFIVALFLDCAPVTLVYMTMVDSICKELGYEKGDRFGKVLTAATLWLVVIGYTSTPISHPIAMVMLGQMSSAGAPVSMLDFCKIGIPFGVLFFIATIVVLRLLCKPDFTKFEKYDPDAKAAQMKTLSPEAKISIGVFAAVVVMWLAPDLLSGVFPGVAAYFSSIGTTCAPLLGIAILAIVHVKGKPVFDVAKGLTQISMPTLIFVMGIQVFCNTITSDATGVNTFLGNVFTPIASSLPPALFIAVILVASVVLTQFLSNMVVQSLFFAAFVPVIQATNAAGVTNFSIAAFGMVLTMAVNVSFMFPSSYMCAPICYGSGYLEIKDGLKLGLPMAVIGTLLLFFIFWPIANALL